MNAAAKPAPTTFVLARVNARGNVTWQINGQGPRLSVRSASLQLSNMAPRADTRELRGKAAALASHLAKLDFEVREEDGSVTQACATAMGWSTLGEWRTGVVALGGSLEGL